MNEGKKENERRINEGNRKRKKENKDTLGKEIKE